MKTSTPSQSPFPACPLPLSEYPRVLLAHGSGGRLMGQLIQRVFLTAFSNPYLDRQHDGAVLSLEGARLAFTTDSYVVHPLFFPGGDIGSLAVNGTVNDLAMCGARPRFLSCGFIIEEGLDMDVLWRVACSMREAAQRAQVQLVTGDTKVVERGKGDGLFINTAGIGVIQGDREVGPPQVRPGDAVILSGDVGRHGIAIMAQRESLAFESPIESDCAPLADPVMALLDAGLDVHCLRDLTRGGLASALVEIAEQGGITLKLEERAIPVLAPIRGACELLGLDPLYVANEGRFVVWLPEDESDRALRILHGFADTENAALIGSVVEERQGRVILRSSIGGERVVDRLSGEQLPRIC